MNERIQQLAQQAEAHANQVNERFGTNFQEEFRSKFAESIIKECSKVNNQFIGHRIGEIDLDLIYKEHFGVEE